MSPAPQQFDVAPSPDVLSGEEVVISGISGLFPKSDDVTQFMENLYNHVDMVEVNDCPFKHHEFPRYKGKINNLNKFDAQFFRVLPDQAQCMDGISRKILEQAYGAIFDAGVNPETIGGKNIGMFVSSSHSDKIAFFFESMDAFNSYVLTGWSKAMLANRISYWINSKATSCATDQSHASSASALVNAYWSIKNGQCEAAIVGGCNEVNHPVLTLNYRKAGFLNLDGKTKCFDKNGDGFVRSEACGLLFLQKAKHAKRIYAEVYYAKTKYFPSPDLSFKLTRDPRELENFLNEFYRDIDVTPEMVEYVEASASGIAEADGNEIEAISNIFAKNKQVKVGSVISNMGHGESASGICSVTKICLAVNTGKLPGNLHYHDPQDHIPAVKSGRVKVVIENEVFNRGYVALNSFSFTGVNVHILLKGHFKAKDLVKYNTAIPRLLLVSGRTESSVEKIINYFKNKQIDPEEIALLHGIFYHNIPSHTTRGYILQDINKDEETITLSESFQHFTGVKKPVWFMYSGMGSQWPSMGSALMCLPVFSAAIERCRKILEPKGVDIIRIITEPDETIFDNILHSFVGIAAVQIALTDILTVLEVIPDNIIGHSVGELGCAYADGCFTAEEMILASYYRGLASIEAKLCKGAMAAVGLGYKDILPLCPPAIEVACHNSSTSCTISGPFEDVKKFVANLKSKGIFAKEVNTANIAYHSRYIAEAGGMLLSNMKKFIKNPKLRSNKWLSTSVLPKNWDKDEAKYCSAEYFTNNLLNNVYFEEVAAMIPSDAIVIEISPHGLMQAVLKRSHESCTHVPLTKREHKDSARFLLEAIGKLYEVGLNPKIEALYPAINFPVSTTTPILSHLVEWEHSTDWSLPSYDKTNRITMCSREIYLSVHDDDWSFIKDHVRDGVAEIPEAVILVLVWETLGMYQGVNYRNLSVSFMDVQFHGAINIQIENTIALHVNIFKGSGRFEITYGDFIIATGQIVSAKGHVKNLDIANTEESNLQLNTKDVYTIMNLRGHFYGQKVRSLQASNLERSKVHVKWNGDWMVLIDALLQIGVLATDHTGVTIPKYINRLNIDTTKYAELRDDENYFATITGNESKIIRCGCVEINNIVFQNRPSAKEVGLISEYSKVKVNDSNNKYNEAYTPPKESKLSIDVYGDIDKLAWIEHSSEQNHAAVQVCYAGISNTDCHRAMGRITKGESFGLDYSGFNQKKEKVMGVIRGGAMATEVEADLDLMWPVPAYWSLEDAATIPLPYLQAYYALTIRSDIGSNENVLIMDAATAFGQACISICLDLNCNVFATVCNSEEKKLLKRTFAQLKENNINDNSSSCIYNTVIINTSKMGCDFVINCGNGDMWKTGLKCLGAYGIFLDVIEVPERKDVGMSFMTFCRNFISVHLHTLFNPENAKEKKILQKRITDGIARGVVRPLSRVVYSAKDVSKAFRLSYKQMIGGRILLNMSDLKTPCHKSNPKPSMTTFSEGTHIVISDASGLGIELVDRLINRGARHVVLNFTRRLGYLKYKIDSWKSSGVKVLLSFAERLDEKGCCKLIEEAKTLGPINGIYITEDIFNINSKRLAQRDCQSNELTRNWKHDDCNIVDNFDHVSKKICPKLKLFVVIALTAQGNKDENELMERMRTCQLRNENGHPSLFFQVEINKEQAKKMEDLLMNIEVANLAKVLNDLELAIKEGKNIAFSNGITHFTKDFVQKIGNVIGKIHLGDTANNTILKDLCRSEMELLEIGDLIKRIHGVTYSVEYLQNMTFGRLKSLAGKDCATKTEIKTGLNALISFVDHDEYRATQPVAVMPTKLAKCTIDNTITELDPSETYLMLVPGFGGHREIFTPICERLKIAQVALQVIPDVQEDNIPDIAKRMIINIKQSFDVKSKFYILGYSFGVNVALELASLMEKEGHTGIVYCLDSSPDAVKIQLDQYVGDLADENVQDKIIKYMYNIISGQHSDDLANELKHINNWQNKVELCILKLKDVVGLSHEYIRGVIKAFYNKVIASHTYTPRFKLQSQIVLLKSAKLLPEYKLTSLAEDYGLSKYSTQPVRVFEIDSDHASIPSNREVANLVNRHLEPRILEEFKHKNLCDFYTLNTSYG